MLSKAIENVDKVDIELLKTNAVVENRRLEYKQALPGAADKDKTEFLRDVSSFANAGGGDIVYGIVERREEGSRGIPDSIPGLEGFDEDREKLRLESVLLSGLEPRLTGHRFRIIPGFERGPVLLLRIPKSFASPHMLKTGEFRFYSRHDAGKYPLDIREIRGAFLGSEALPEKIRRFRDERLGRIIASETPIALPPGPKVILHMIPYSAFDSPSPVDLLSIQSSSEKYPPMYRFHIDGWNTRFNLDGLLTVGTRSMTGEPLTYLQNFHNGIIETVSSDMVLGPDSPQSSRGDWKRIETSGFEGAIIKFVTKYLSMMEQLAVSPPILIWLTLAGVKEFELTISPNFFLDQHNKSIDRDIVMLPEAYLDNYAIRSDVALRPTLDGFWQTSGYARDHHYLIRDDGRWRAHHQSAPL